MRTRNLWLTVLIAGEALLIGSAAGAAAVSSQDVHSVVTIEDDGNTVVITRDNEEVTVKLNGEIVPADRLQRDGRRLRVLDENGEVVAEIQLMGDRTVLRDAQDEQRRLERREHGVERRARAAVEAVRRRAQMGVMLGRVDEVVGGQLDVDPDEVVLITEVMPGLAADKAGMKPHDIVVRVDGQSPVTPQQLREIVLSKRQGDMIRVEILREGDHHEELEIKLEPYVGSSEAERREEELALRELEEGSARRLHEHLGRLYRGGQVWRGWQQHLQERPEIAEELRLHAERLRPELLRGLRHLRRDTTDVMAEVREHLHEGLSKLEELMEDEELQRKLEETIEHALDQATAALEDVEIGLDEIAPRIEFFRRDGAGRGLLIHPPQPPAPPDAPAPPQFRRDRDDVRRLERPGSGASGPAARSEQLEDRFNRLEERLERLEQMIRRLAEQRSSN